MHAFFVAKIMHDELNDLEDRVRLEGADLRRLEVFADEDALFFRNISEQRAHCESEIRRHKLDQDSLADERSAIERAMRQVEDKQKEETERLSADLAKARDQNVQYLSAVADTENRIRRLGRQASELEQTLNRQTMEIGKLTRMKEGNPAEEDEVLREKKEMESKLESMSTLNEEYIASIAQVDRELQEASEECLKQEILHTDTEARLVQLANQRVELIGVKNKTATELETMKSDISKLEDERTALTNNIMENENLLSGSLGKQLREVTRTNRSLLGKFECVRRNVAEGSVKLQEAERSLTDKISRLHALTTQNEFAQNEIEALEDSLTESRNSKVALQIQLEEETKRDISAELETIRREVETLQGDIENNNTELLLLKEHGLLGPDGLLRPILIEAVPGPSLSLVDQLGLNDFLARIQSGSDLRQIVIQLVEKISEILQMIHEAEELEQRYVKDHDRASEFVKQLKLKNAEGQSQLEDLEKFRKSALVQIGKNHLQSSHGTKLMLQGLGYTDSDLEDLVNALSIEEKTRVSKVSLAKCNLEKFSLIRLISDFPELKELSICDNPLLETLNELERFLRNKVDGITGVFRDSNIIIANSGLQVRLTVYHGSST